MSIPVPGEGKPLRSKDILAYGNKRIGYPTQTREMLAERLLVRGLGSRRATGLRWQRTYRSDQSG